MSNQKITELNILTSSEMSPEDLFLVVDLNSDETGLPETKRISSSEIINYFSQEFAASSSGNISQSLNNLTSTVEALNSSYLSFSSSYLEDSSSVGLRLSQKLNNSDTGSYTSYGIPVLNSVGKIYSEFLPASALSVTSVFGRGGDVVPSSTDYSAALISFTPVGGVSSTNVQNAISEIDIDKLSVSGGTMIGDLYINESLFITKNLSVNSQSVNYSYSVTNSGSLLVYDRAFASRLTASRVYINSASIDNLSVARNATANSQSVNYSYSVTNSGSLLVYDRAIITNLTASRVYINSASINNVDIKDIEKISINTASIGRIVFSDSTVQTTAATENTGIYKFPEWQSSRNSRDINDGVAFINKSKEVLCIGTGSEGRFGPSDVYPPGIILPLPMASSVEKLYVGFSATFMIDDLGNAYGLGGNTFGQIGISGSKSNILKPTRLTDSASVGLTNIKKIAMSGDYDGGDFHCFLKDSGDLYVAGNNEYGARGIGNTLDTGNSGSIISIGPNNNFTNPTQSVSDVIVVGGFDNLSGGTYTSICLLENGEVYSAGYNGDGQIGNGSGSITNSTWQRVILTGSNVPLTNIVTIAGAGRSYTPTIYALNSDKILYGWGNNQYGQLNTASLTVKRAAIPVTSQVDKFWVFGQRPSLFVKKTDGILYACGYNGNGELGLGNTNDALSLTAINSGSMNSNIDVEEIYSGISNYGSGNMNSIFILGRQKTLPFRRVLLAAGSNFDYQLGLGDNIERNTFTEVPFKNVEEIKDIMPFNNQINYGISAYGCTWILLNSGKVYFAGKNRWNWARFDNGAVTEVPFFSPCPHLLQ